MNILAVNTTSEICSVALSLGDQAIVRETTAAKAQIGELLVLMQAVLDEAGYTLNQLTALAVTIGPGSFTGLRIGTGVIQGVAYAANLPVVLISSLAVMAQTAYRCYQSTRVCVALDAKMGELYMGYYHVALSAKMEPMMADSLCSPDALPALPEATWVGVGDGWKMYVESLSQHYPAEQIYPQLVPSALDMLPLAMTDYQNQRAVGAPLVLPNYLRNSSAWKK